MTAVARALLRIPSCPHVKGRVDPDGTVTVMSMMSETTFGPEACAAMGIPGTKTTGLRQGAEAEAAMRRVNDALALVLANKGPGTSRAATGNTDEPARQAKPGALL